MINFFSVLDAQNVFHESNLICIITGLTEVCQSFWSQGECWIIEVVSNETNTDVRMYNLILLDDLHYSMYK